MMLEDIHKIQEHAKERGGEGGEGGERGEGGKGREGGRGKEREGEGEESSMYGFCQVIKNQDFPPSRGSYACLLDMVLLCVNSCQFSGKM